MLHISIIANKSIGFNFILQHLQFCILFPALNLQNNTNNILLTGEKTFSNKSPQQQLSSAESSHSLAHCSAQSNHRTFKFRNLPAGGSEKALLAAARKPQRGIGSGLSRPNITVMSFFFYS